MDDFTALEKEFGFQSISTYDVDLVNNMRSQLPAPQDLPPDPDDILYKNIKRAEKILDKLEESILIGESPSARLIEVYGQILNSITSASTSLSGNTFARQKQEYNMKIADIKEQEVEVKRIVAQSKIDGDLTPIGKNTGKVMVMDRESMLRMIKEDKVEVQVKSHGQKENL